MPNKGLISLLQMDGILTMEEFEKALNLAVDGCKKIYEVQKAALKRKYDFTEKLKREADKSEE